MPSDLAKAVRMFHTPSKHDFRRQLLRSQVNEEAGNIPNTFDITEEPEVLVDAALARRRSAAARAILDSATSGELAI